MSSDGSKSLTIPEISAKMAIACAQYAFNPYIMAFEFYM